MPVKVGYVLGEHSGLDGGVLFVHIPTIYRRLGYRQQIYTSGSFNVMGAVYFQGSDISYIPGTSHIT